MEKGGRVLKEKLKAFSFLAPALLIYIIIIVFPGIYSVVLSLFEWNGVAEKRFVGLANYVKLFTNDDIFRIALKNNVIWIVLTVCITVVLALILALVLNGKFTGRIVYRSIFYFPYMLSWIVIGIIWKWMYNPNFGMINTFLGAVGLDSLKGSYLSNPKIALYCIFAAALWQGLGQPMLYFLAGLQTMSSDVLEAARIDGATKFQCFKSITLPMVTKLSVPLVISTFASNFNNFGNIYMITQGGPARVDNQFAGYTDILASTTYKMTTWSNRYELSATFSVLIFIIVGTFTLINMHLSGSFKEVN